MTEPDRQQEPKKQKLSDLMLTTRAESVLQFLGLIGGLLLGALLGWVWMQSGLASRIRPFFNEIVLVPLISVTLVLLLIVNRLQKRPAQKPFVIALGLLGLLFMVFGPGVVAEDGRVAMLVWGVVAGFFSWLLARQYGYRLLPPYPRGVGYLARGQYEQATRDLTESLRRDPLRVAAYYMRGMARSGLRLFDLALADSEEAVRLEPNNPNFIWFRGAVHLYRREFARARADYQEALRLDPDHLNAHGGLCWLYASCSDDHFRDGKKAVEHGYAACEMSPIENAFVLEAYAAAFAELGDFDKAVKFQRQALAPPEKRGKNTRKIVLIGKAKEEAEQRLALYERDLPYRLELDPPAQPREG